MVTLEDTKRMYDEVNHPNFKIMVDTVAMSVCEEVIAARHVGMRVLGISLCSNMACGVDDANPSDWEVFEVAKRAEPMACRFITGIVAEL